MRTRIIAEVGANHGGDLDLAKKMIAVAADCGVDFVKFQSWQARTLAPGDPNFERHQTAELSDDDHRALIDECRRHGVAFLTTCFDVARADFLATLGLTHIKVASPDVGSTRLLTALAERFEHVIVSTGMAPEIEVVAAAETLAGHDFTLLHCVSLYPTPSEKVNLLRMDWLRTLAPSVGFSDHSMGTAAARIAISRGADYVEKHFTVDRGIPGKDQAVSGVPHEFRELVAHAEAVEHFLGTARPELTEEELGLREVYVGKWGDNR
jgi:N,N'-diacetyllegionaminate synthase